MPAVHTTTVIIIFESLLLCVLECVRVGEREGALVVVGFGVTGAGVGGKVGLAKK